MQKTIRRGQCKLSSGMCICGDLACSTKAVVISSEIFQYDSVCVNLGGLVDERLEFNFHVHILLLFDT